HLLGLALAVLVLDGDVRLQELGGEGREQRHLLRLDQDGALPELLPFLALDLQRLAPRHGPCAHAMADPLAATPEADIDHPATVLALVYGHSTFPSVSAGLPSRPIPALSAGRPG